MPNSASDLLENRIWTDFLGKLPRGTVIGQKSGIPWVKCDFRKIDSGAALSLKRWDRSARQAVPETAGRNLLLIDEGRGLSRADTPQEASYNLSVLNKPTTKSSLRNSLERVQALAQESLRNSDCRQKIVEGSRGIS
jgi:hypothetical protein